MSDGNPPMYEWKCSEPGCKRFISAYTENGLTLLIADHNKQHQREAEERGETTALVLAFRPKDYNKLQLNHIDIGFLKTRHIKIDDDIELDLVTEPKPSKTELHQGQWARILNNAWAIIPPGEKDGTIE